MGELKNLNKIAEKDGLKGLNRAIEIILTNKSNGAADIKEATGKSADNTDTRSYYEQYEDQ